MNISDPLWPTKKQTNETALPRTSARDVAPLVNNSTLLSTEATHAIVNAIQSSGSHLWTLQSYWYVTIPVTITTIIVPMVIGIIFRSISRFAFHHRGYWRLIVVVGIALLVVMFDILISLLGGGVIAMIVVIIVLGITALALLSISLVKKKHRLRWCGFAISVAIYPTIWWLNDDYFSNFFSIFIPFTYLLFVWFRQDIMKLFKNVTGRCRPPG